MKCIACGSTLTRFMLSNSVQSRSARGITCSCRASPVSPYMLLSAHLSWCSQVDATARRCGVVGGPVHVMSNSEA